MIDTHGHLNLEPLVNDWRMYWQQAQAAGVTDIIMPGVDRTSSEKAIEIALTDNHLFAAAGIHPQEAQRILTDGTNLEELKTWISKQYRNKKIVAIGECGLDYFRLPDSELDQKHAKAAQKKVFEYQLKIAQDINSPIIVHVREAQEDALELLKKYPVKTVLHCFSGNESYLKQALNLGFYISLAGNVTFANAKELQDLITQVPMERILLETDAPYLNPIRGQFPNAPANIVDTYDFLAELFAISREELVKYVTFNSQKLFGI